MRRTTITIIIVFSLFAASAIMLAECYLPAAAQPSDDIAYGGTLTGSISDMHLFAFAGFSGLAGDHIRIEVQGNGLEMHPTLLLLSDNTQIATSGDVGGQEESNFAAIEYDLPETRSYTIVVQGTRAGEFTLSLDTVPPLIAPTSTPDNSPALPEAGTPTWTPQTNDGLPIAPRDTEPGRMNVPYEEPSTFSGELSVPQGDRYDNVLISMVDLLPGVPREVLITLACEGENTNALRWEVEEASPPTTLGCGGTYQTYYYRESENDPAPRSMHNLYLTGDAPNYITYTFTAKYVAIPPGEEPPGTPINDVINFTLTLEEARTLSGELLSLGGDAEQPVIFRLPGVPVGQTHNFEIRLKCDADAQTIQLTRLQIGANNYFCGQAVTVPFSRDALSAEASVAGAVWIDDAANLDYTLTAQRVDGPAASEDADTHLLTLLPEGLATFSSAVSAPSGDLMDTVIFALPGLGADQSAQYAVGMVCAADAGALIAVLDGLEYACGAAIPLTVTGHSVPALQIFMAEPGFAAYTLTAQPMDVPPGLPPLDTTALDETFYADLSAAGGQFAGYVPAGGTDVLHLTLLDVAEAETGLRLTLTCTGGSIQAEDAGPFACGSSFVLPWIESPTRTVVITGADTHYLLRAEPLDAPDPVGEIAPPDGDHTFAVALDGPASFSETISAPEGDTSDVIRVIAAGLPVGESRAFDLALTCVGVGGELGATGVRWEPAGYDGPPLGCGSSHTIQLERPQAESGAALEMVVRFIPGAGFITYTLSAEPVGGLTAPQDAATHLFMLDPEGPASFSEALSYPQGDPQDAVMAAVPNLQPGEWANFSITLTCAGEAASALRWLLDGIERECDDTGQLTLPGTPIELLVYLEGGTVGYATYNLLALPVSAPVVPPPIDTTGGLATHFVTIPADGAAFSDAVANAVAEQVLVDVEGLFSGTHVYSLTLACAGTAAGDLRWEAESLTIGGPLPGDLRCGDTTQLVYDPLDANAPSAFTVRLALDAQSGASVPYTLYITPLGSIAGGEALHETVPLVFEVAVDRATALSQAVSTPGDNEDLILARVPGLAVGQPYTFEFTVRCAGMNTDYLTWTTDAPTSQAEYACGETATVILERTDPQFEAALSLAVRLRGGPAIVSYSVEALPVGDPIAGLDDDAYLWELDPANLSTFVEAVSFPAGDTLDTVHVGGRAGDYVFMLRCGGTGTVYWDFAGARHQCGESVTITMPSDLLEMRVQLADPGHQYYVIEALPVTPFEGEAADAPPATADTQIAEFPPEGGIYTGSVPKGGVDNVEVYITGNTPSEGAITFTVLCGGPHADALLYSVAPDQRYPCGKAIEMAFSRDAGESFQVATFEIAYVGGLAPTAPPDDELAYVLLLEPGYVVEPEPAMRPVTQTPAHTPQLTATPQGFQPTIEPPTPALFTLSPTPFSQQSSATTTPDPAGAPPTQGASR